MWPKWSVIKINQAFKTKETQLREGAWLLSSCIVNVFIEEVFEVIPL